MSWVSGVSVSGVNLLLSWYAKLRVKPVTFAVQIRQGGVSLSRRLVARLTLIVCLVIGDEEKQQQEGAAYCHKVNVLIAKCHN